MIRLVQKSRADALCFHLGRLCEAPHQQHLKVCSAHCLSPFLKQSGLMRRVDSVDASDIIDEVLFFFKANVLFKHFEVKGPADRVLIYLTLYITQCLKRLETGPSLAEAQKTLTMLSLESFPIPGDPAFPLGTFFPAPADLKEAGAHSTAAAQLFTAAATRCALAPEIASDALVHGQLLCRMVQPAGTYWAVVNHVEIVLSV